MSLREKVDEISRSRREHKENGKEKKTSNRKSKQKNKIHLKTKRI